MAVKVNKKKYKYIENILNEILPNKYLKDTHKVYILDSRIEVLKFIRTHNYSIKELVGRSKKNVGANVFYRSGNILIHRYNSKRFYKDDKTSDRLDASTIVNILHEIRHKHRFHNNPTWHLKHSSNNLDPFKLKSYWDDPQEKDAQNFAITIVNKNKKYIDSIIGDEWSIDYIV